MGADFNILEYADPELDKVGSGEKTNIFDVEEFEEEDSKKDAAWVGYQLFFFFSTIKAMIKNVFSVLQ